MKHVSATWLLRAGMAICLWAFALSKLTRGPVGGTLWGEQWSWATVSVAEIVIGVLLVTRTYWRLGCWMVVAFAVGVVLVVFADRPCGCGGAWFTMTTKAKLATACFLAAGAFWTLSTRGRTTRAAGGAAVRQVQDVIV